MGDDEASDVFKKLTAFEESIEFEEQETVGQREEADQKIMPWHSDLKSGSYFKTHSIDFTEVKSWDDVTDILSHDITFNDFKLIAPVKIIFIGELLIGLPDYPEADEMLRKHVKFARFFAIDLPKGGVIGTLHISVVTEQLTAESYEQARNEMAR